jgi:hypothetical protein
MSLKLRGVAALAVAFGMALASGGAFAAGGAAANTPTTSGLISPASSTPCAGCFAVVDGSGGFVRGKGTVSVTHLSTGTYDIRFNKPIGKCAWTATVGLATFGGSAGPAEVTLAGRAGTKNGIFLQTFNGSGVATDEPFHLLISC